jgi:hypothetical protein
MGGAREESEVVYLVKNELWRVGIDGSGAAKIGTVGDDAYRTGYARKLAEGRYALLADDTGVIRPYVYEGTASRTVGARAVTLWDALTAVSVAGEAAFVYTETPFEGGSARLMRADPVAGDVATVAEELDGVVTEPAEWDDGRVLVVRKARGQVTVEIVGVGSAGEGAGEREVLTTVDAPYGAHAPARLADGRVVFVRTDPRDSTDTAVGEMFVLERGGGEARTTGITGVVELVVVGGYVVYEVGGADGVTDLVRTDLVGAPVNLTKTATVAEHLGWSSR